MMLIENSPGCADGAGVTLLLFKTAKGDQADYHENQSSHRDDLCPWTLARAGSRPIDV
jgi:hypothetical protein